MEGKEEEKKGREKEKKFSLLTAQDIPGAGTELKYLYIQSSCNLKRVYLGMSGRVVTVSLPSSDVNL